MCETNLVAGCHQSPNEASDDHDFIDQDSVEDRRPWETGSEEEIHKQQWGGDDPDLVSLNSQMTRRICIPINVSNVEDLTEIASDLGVGAHELRLDASLSQVGAHGEVGDGRDHRDGGSDVMEDTVRARLRKGQASESDS